MKCRYCGNELRSGERFCRKCGKPAEAESVQSPRFCIECGAELLPNDVFCRRCGTPVSPSTGEAQTAQTRQSAASRHNQFGKADEKAELKRRTEILVLAAQGGDSSSFTELYNLYYQKVYALAKTTVKSDADAEDVLQTTFIKAWNHLDRLKDTSAFSPWIQRITLNQCYSLLRKQHVTIPIDNDDEDSEPIQIESDLMLPEVYAEQNDQKKRLGKIIDELSDVQKQTITLYYFDGLPVENIAWIMNCSANTVKSRLFLARKSIRTEIEEQERKSGQPFYGIVGLGLVPFGSLFVNHVREATLSKHAASALLKTITHEITENAAGAVKPGTSAAVRTGAKTAVSTGAKAAGAGAKTAAAAGASVFRKVIAGIIAGTLATGTVAGGTAAAVSIVQNNRERKAAESATTVVTDGTFPSVTASDPFLPQDPSGGLSAQEPKAYQAYLDYLIAHKEGIDNYLWQIGGWEYYYEIEEGTDRFVPRDEPMTEDARLETRSVVFYDISGDALPELIYVGDVASPAKYTSVCTLNVLTYRDDQLVSLFSGEWYQPKWEDFTEAESLYVRPDGTLVSYYSEGATFDSLDYYEVFAAGENGTLHREFALKHVYDSFEYDEGDGSPIVEEWYGPNKERITKEEYEAQLKGVMPKDCILLFDRYSYASFAMNADEAIAWLQSQLGMTAEAHETPTKPADEAAAESPGSAADNASRVRLTALKSIDSVPRETDTRLTDNYETAYEYAVINNHGYNGSAGPLCYEFLTNAKYRLFTGTIYVPNGETSEGFSSLTVKGDGFTLYTSPAMSKTSKPVPFEVNVAGFNDIVIEWSNNSGYGNISKLNCCIGDAYFVVDPDGSEQPDRLHLPVSLTDLNSIYSAARRNTRLMDNFGNTYNKAIYNRIDNLHGNEIPVLEYLLNAQYSRFCCTLYIPEGSSFRSPVVMHVLADDVEIYVSPEMTATSGPVEVDIDLSGCVNLKITFSAGSWYNSTSDATLCLANPYLYLAGDR